MWMQLNVIVPGTLHPKRLDSLRTPLVDSDAMGEVDDLVVGAVDNQNGSLHLSHLINAGEGVKEPGSLCVSKDDP